MSLALPTRGANVAGSRLVARARPRRGVARPAASDGSSSSKSSSSSRGEPRDRDDVPSRHWSRKLDGAGRETTRDDLRYMSSDGANRANADPTLTQRVMSVQRDRDNITLVGDERLVLPFLDALGRSEEDARGAIELCAPYPPCAPESASSAFPPSPPCAPTSPGLSRRPPPQGALPVVRRGRHGAPPAPPHRPPRRIRREPRQAPRDLPRGGWTVNPASIAWCKPQCSTPSSPTLRWRRSRRRPECPARKPRRRIATLLALAVESAAVRSAYSASRSG